MNITDSFVNCLQRQNPVPLQLRQDKYMPNYCDKIEWLKVNGDTYYEVCYILWKSKPKLG